METESESTSESDTKTVAEESSETDMKTETSPAANTDTENTASETKYITIDLSTARETHPTGDAAAPFDLKSYPKKKTVSILQTNGTTGKDYPSQ